MTITKFQKESVLTFARFLDHRYSALAAYAEPHDLDFKPPSSSFGGAPGASGFRSVADGRATEPVYTFKPMTMDEYQKASGVNLDWRYEPNSLSPEDEGSRATSVKVQDETSKWHDFYNRGGRLSGGEWTEDLSGEDAPWAKPLRDTWYAAVDDRLEEVKVVRNEMAFFMRILMRLAEWYPEVDLESSVKLKKYAAH